MSRSDRPGCVDDHDAGLSVGELQVELARLRAENGTLVRLTRLQDRFVAMASHEFKTPLTSITSYTEALLAHAHDPHFDRGPQFLGVIRDEAARLLRMVNRILDFSRMEYGSRLLARREVNLAELADETRRTLQATADAKGLTVDLAAPAGLMQAEVDDDLVRQVLVNLLGNAVKFTPRGGAIAVTVTEEPAHVAVSVSDSGPGIPPDEICRIFRAFYRADATGGDQPGTGLGLSIVRHIVNLHGGYVDVRSEAGEGSVFTFGVPKLVHTTADDAPVPVAHPSVLRALTLLLADQAGARAAVLLLAADGGALRPAAWTGIRSEVRLAELVPAPRGDAVADGTTLAADLNLGHDPGGAWYALPVSGGRGWVLLGRRAGAPWTNLDGTPGAVLGRIAAQALRGGADDPGRTVEALRVLLQIKRGGIPTATAEALQMTTDLARTLGLSEADTARLQDAAALHDAGMARVDDEILRGEGDLDWDARDEVDRHVQLGLDLLAPLLGDPATAEIIRHHHERFDGSGHPDNLAGPAIPLGSRILAVVDAWCSLTMERPYRGGLAPVSARREIERCTGTQFDPAVVRAFGKVVGAVAASSPADAAIDEPAKV